MRILTITVLCGVLAACGGDDDGSGVDSDKPFSEATVDDAMAFCEYIDALTDPEVEQKIDCYVEGLIAGDQGEDCQAVADDCLAEPAEEEPNECNEIDESDVTDLPACASEITFGEMEACFEALVGRNNDVAAEISCDSDLEEIFDQNQDLPEVCTDLQDECPDLFEG
ncbi:MAG TPA: hypothetical protein VMZ28_02390 [Kofleriaceae bacterium]|nr:hypothetical protein [Kofleriaceae bacterium]